MPLHNYRFRHSVWLDSIQATNRFDGTVRQFIWLDSWHIRCYNTIILKASSEKVYSE